MESGNSSRKNSAEDLTFGLGLDVAGPAGDDTIGSYRTKIVKDDFCKNIRKSLAKFYDHTAKQIPHHQNWTLVEWFVEIDKQFVKDLYQYYKIKMEDPTLNSKDWVILDYDDELIVKFKLEWG